MSFPLPAASGPLSLRLRLPRLLRGARQARDARSGAESSGRRDGAVSPRPSGRAGWASGHCGQSWGSLAPGVQPRGPWRPRGARGRERGAEGGFAGGSGGGPCAGRE